MPNRRIYARAEDLEEVKQDVRDIRKNALPHLACEIKKIDRKIYYILGALAILIPLVCVILQRLL